MEPFFPWTPASQRWVYISGNGALTKKNGNISINLFKSKKYYLESLNQPKCINLHQQN